MHVEEQCSNTVQYTEPAQRQLSVIRHVEKQHTTPMQYTEQITPATATCVSDDSEGSGVYTPRSSQYESDDMNKKLNIILHKLNKIENQLQLLEQNQQANPSLVPSKIFR
ncbi:uncharacterized protein LOC116165428 [Photinus pyralis]|uniref:uncharacterized protein LOC116159132 n=1 Tax=Photinus pyralis TaxID=7054 RepID=UPI0012670791|nr:uncharacterized protein LOC116159132 [Photinus pyralis]XP_031335737.1 uncharacterized protein LOC116165428 [Photinus pyralis]